MWNIQTFTDKYIIFAIQEYYTYFGTLRAIFTKILTRGLTCVLSNLLNEWLDWLIPTKYRAGYLIRRLIQKLKILWIKILVLVKIKLNENSKICEKMVRTEKKMAYLKNFFFFLQLTAIFFKTKCDTYVSFSD